MITLKDFINERLHLNPDSRIRGEKDKRKAKKEEDDDNV